MKFLTISKRIRAAHLAAERKIGVASVAVIWNHRLLMMKRRDNGKWTLPGGHLDPGESPYDGAIRELREETGIRAWRLYCLGHERVTGPSGRQIDVHAFRLDTTHQIPTAGLDPDSEAQEFKWVSFATAPLPPELQPQNLHVRRNVVLKYLGLQQW